MMKIRSGLRERGMVTTLPRRGVARGRGGELRNGWFGIGKDKYLPDCPPEPDFEILRFIMNFVPLNGVSMPVLGDVTQLPYMGQWSNLQLQSWEFFVWSSDDIACMFYIISVPSIWHALMAFNCDVDSAEGSEKDVALCATVLGMGWLSSVGIAQHLIRQLMLAAPRWGAGLDPHSELRRDQPLPRRDARGCWRFWSAYLDDFDNAESGTREELEAKLGEVGEWQKRVRQAYEVWGIPRGEGKEIVRSFTAERLGAFLDGRRGAATGTPRKLLELLSLFLHTLQQQEPGQTLVEMLCGRFIHRMQFRRATMGSLTRIWKYLRRWGRRRRVPIEVEEDLMVAAGLLPLMLCDFRATVSGTITCSDASEAGSGVCVSSGLTVAGESAVRALGADTPLPGTSSGGVLIVSLFDGVGSLAHCAHSAGLPIAGILSAECDPAAARVAATHFPRAVHLDDVSKVDGECLKDLRRQHARVSLIILGGGFPCQEFYSLNVQKHGLDPLRGALVRHLPRVRDLLLEAFPGVPLELLAVGARMGPEQSGPVSRILGRAPILIDPSEFLWCRRPRLYWISWPIVSAPGALIDPEAQPPTVTLTASRPALCSCLSKGWVPHGDFPGAFGTFTRTVPAPKPGRMLAGSCILSQEEKEVWANEGFRYAPHQYTSRNLVWKDGVSRSLSAEEREVILGYPKGYTEMCGPRSVRSGSQGEFIRCGLLGNGWAVPVVTWLLGQLGWHRGLLPCPLSPQDCLARAGPLQPSAPACAAEASPERLALELLRHVDHTGGELRRNPFSQEVPHVWPRRSVDPRWWRWRVALAHAWPKGEMDHINKLEARSLLASLRWRARDPSRLNCKIFHFTDSAVTMGIVSKARSASLLLQLTSDRINAAALAGHFRVVLAHVTSKSNPADAPSRAGFLRKVQKKLTKTSSGLATARRVRNPQCYR